MKKRDKVASIILFLATLAVGFDAQPGWSQWLLHPPSAWKQCTIKPGAFGMAVLPDGRVLVATGTGLAYFPSFPADPSQCPTGSPIPLNSTNYNSLTIGLDGKVYAFKFPYPFDFVSIDPNTGKDTVIITYANGLGMALDPLTGDIYMSSTITSSTIYRITGLYGGTPSMSAFASAEAGFDGLGWSCDGRYLFAASPATDQVFRFDRLGNHIFASLPAGTGPDGIAVGAEGTVLAGYFFTNDRDGTVTRIRNGASSLEPQFVIASNAGNGGGDFAFVDAQGAMVAIQGDHLERLSSTSGGKWVLPGSTLCSDLGCGAKAATTAQVDHENQACLTGLNADLVLTLSQSACGSCESCNTLNQARGTLEALLNSLDPPLSCLDGLKLTVHSLYHSCPCDLKACPPPCVNCPNITKLSGGTCLAKTKLPLGLGLEFYDPVLQPFMRRGSP
jgi:hypothetical protein